MIDPKMPKFGDIFAAHDDAVERANYARKVWHETLAETDVNSKGHAAMIERYTLLRTEFEFFFAEATHAGMVKTGPNNGDVFNMKYAALLKLLDQIRKDEAALLIAPKDAGLKAPGMRRPKKRTPADEFLGAAH